MQSKRSTYHGNVPSLYASIDGSRGTAVFGDGIDAVTGEVTEVHPDYFRLEGDNGSVYHVRRLVYWRLRG